MSRPESPQVPAASPADRAGAAKSRSGSLAASKSFGRFQILKLLGRGAFGSVYRAHDPQLDRSVALKIPHSGAIGSEADAQRFLREARAAGQLRHPYIVPVFDAGQVGGTYYIASAFVEGISLRAAIRAGRFADRRAAAELLVKLADALHYAHDQGIVHRDLKPENILVDQAGAPYVLDFGLARRQEDNLMTVDGAVIGTPLYMSPEQASGNSNLADKRSDVWSLGVVLYELLCGDRPFDGAGHGLYKAILESSPVAPRKHDPAVPRDLETITLKCLAKEPGQRYQTCAALRKDLEHWLADEPIEARRTGPTERAWRWSKKNPALAAAAALVGLLAAVSTLTAIGLERSRAEVQAEATRAQAALDRLNAEALRRQKLEQALEVRQAEIVEKEAKLTAAEDQLERRMRELEDRNSELAKRDSMLKEKDSTLATVTADLNDAKLAAGNATAAAASAKAAEQRLRENSGTDPLRFYQEQLQTAMAAASPELTLAALDACPPDERGWEWQYLLAITSGTTVRWTKVELPEVNARNISTGPRAVYKPLAFDPAGRRLLVLRRSRGGMELVTFDESGREIAVATPKSLSEATAPAAFDKAGDLAALLIKVKDKSTVWFGAAGPITHAAQIGRMRPVQLTKDKDPSIQAVCLSPDGKSLACLSQSAGPRSGEIQHLSIHELSPYKCLLRGQKDIRLADLGQRLASPASGKHPPFTSLAFNSSGEFLLLERSGNSSLLVRCGTDLNSSFWADPASLPSERTTPLPADGLANHAFTLLVDGGGGITELPTGRLIRPPAEALGTPLGITSDDSRLVCGRAAASGEASGAGAMVYCVYDLSDAAKGGLRRMTALGKAHLFGLPTRGGSESQIPPLETLPSLPGELTAGWDAPRLVVGSRMNAFALSWMDKDGSAHLRVWGP